LRHEKTRWRWSPAGLGASLDLSGLLNQAMAVRRHGSSMMVVMAVMAGGLHLIETLKEDTGRCQMISSCNEGWASWSRGSESGDRSG
jgi:hypothetical protein